MIYNATSSFVTVSCSGVGSGVGSRVTSLSKLFIENILLLKLLRTFSLALYNNPKLFKKYFFKSVFIPLSKLFNPLTKLLCLLSIFSIDKCRSSVSLKKQ